MGVWDLLEAEGTSPPCPVSGVAASGVWLCGQHPRSSCPHPFDSLPPWSLGFFLLLTAGQPGLPVLAEGCCFSCPGGCPAHSHWPQTEGLCRRLKLNEVHLADERAEAQHEKGVCLSLSEPRVAFCSSLPYQESGRPTDSGFDLEEMEKLGPQRQISMAKTRAGCVTSGTLPNLSEPQVLVRMHEMTTAQGLAWTKQVLSYD